MQSHHRLGALLIVLALVACGGGGGDDRGSGAIHVSTPPQGTTRGESDYGSSTPESPPAAPNTLPVIVDRGPGLFFLTGQRAANVLYATVKICTPGSATECDTIDHVAVDTGSVGLRVLADAMIGQAKLAATTDPASGAVLRECAQFADGHAWGTVKKADVEIGGRRIASLPIQVIGDASAGAPPRSTCALGRAKNSVSAFGANGLLGIGPFLQDCGAKCNDLLIAGWYHTCASAGTGSLCKPIKLAPAHQLQNPVARLDTDNNGVTIALPRPTGGAPMLTGNVHFGVNTKQNNAIGAAQLLTLDSLGALTTTYASKQHRAIVDTGSNGYFFATDIPLCKTQASFYCPAANGAPVSLPQTAHIAGLNATSRAVTFTVDNADLYSLADSVMPGLAAPAGSLVGGWDAFFIWGLPFFYGRTVHVLFEGQSQAGTNGPAVAF